MSRLRSGQWLAVTAGGLVFAALIGIVVCLIALQRLGEARREVVERLDPAAIASARYLTALVDEETGLRGFELAGREAFLRPYVTGSRDAAVAHRQLQRIAETGDAPGLAEDLRNVGVASSAWHLLYANPVILTVRAKGKGARDLPSLTSGKVQFDQVRAAFGQLDDNLAVRRDEVREDLRQAANAATAAVIFTAALLLLVAIVAGVTLRRTVAKPLSRLARDARRIARGEFDHPVAVQGPRDIQGLSTDVESMRRRIIAELEVVNRSRAQLEEQTVDLQRSNAELEQFAYVASHDLQEPLRKVASFTGMLQHRYQGQLDERADQYIDFAVDGAKRMQVLINDLLAFSRVGRVGAEQQVVDMDQAAADAVGDLGAAIEEAGAQVTVDGPLPQVRGDRSLLTALLQNLLANAIKFRGDEPPRVRLSFERTADPDGGGDAYTFTVSDNGIGIAPRYADRIFVIFQRLHPKEEYTGTGIGLAMCRKIVEFHGGRIWLEADPAHPEDASSGATFRFTLPVPEEDTTP
jgi:signal transduction histidine kinase